MAPVKEFFNRLISGEDMDKSLAARFYGPRCIVTTRSKCQPYVWHKFCQVAFVQIQILASAKVVTKILQYLS